MIKQLFASFLILLCMLLIQTGILSNIPELPVMPDLLMITVMYISFYNGIFIGESVGFMSGLMVDFLSSAAFGLGCLSRTAIGFLCGFFHRTINTKGVIMPAVLGAAVTVSKVLLNNFISLFYPQNQITAYNIFSYSFLFEIGINAILTPFVFFFLSLFNSFLVTSNSEMR
ncbi:MAG: hypothetical protein Ta2A_04660 [Treponemataceae bacterium]|nr:MAG: hypothetical protein Ta2A_04660 [Treponemataceae bacterium]